MYVSTDYVFDGTKGSVYDEYDTPNPQSVYGRSKRAGEIHVERLCPKHYIVRTAWLYGHGGKNFVETILKAASERPELKVVDDQWGSPTWTVDLSRAMVALLATGRYGTYHVTGSGICTWRDFARKIVELGELTTPVLPQTTEELNRPAPRPRYSGMAHRGLTYAGIQAMPDWQDSLRHYIRARN
ncbi:dTDP-4-dehydrorhamnose reductase [compost metagenome]